MHTNKNIKISIVIPVYNGEKFLEGCLANVLKQTLNEIEILCVDDGSTDSSANIIRKFSEVDSRVILFTQENLGPGPARNLAMENACGEYIAFMDSDDQYPSIDTLEKMYNAAKSHNVQVVAGYRSMFTDGDILPDKNDPLVNLANQHPQGALLEYRNVQFDFNYQAYIYNRQMLQDNEIIFPDYRRFQDPPFFVRAMITAKEFFLLPCSTYVYRWGHQNIQWNARKINDMVCGHIDNLKISKDYDLNTLHTTTAQRLEKKYRNLLLEQFNATNFQLFSLIVYANEITDLRVIESVTEKKYEKHELTILKDFREKMHLLLIEKYSISSENENLLDLLIDLVDKYKDLNSGSDQVIVNELLAILAGLYSITVPYCVRMALFQLLESESFAELGWLQRENIVYSPKAKEAVVTLQSAMDARKFERKINVIVDRKLHCVHDCSLPYVPKVSVIIPVYNVEAYVAECLESVTKQTLKEIEIICVDDGSPDNSIDILLRYANEYPNIRVLQQINGGLSAARNAGISYATGEYIHFLDSDDSVKVNTYEELYKRAKENNLDILFFDAESIYETKELEKKYPWYKTGYTSKNNSETVQCGRDFYISHVVSGTLRASASLYITKTSFMKKEKLLFKEGIIHEDNLFTNTSLMLADKVSHVSIPYFNRLVREGSITIGESEFRHAYGYFASFIGLYHFISQRKTDKSLQDIAYIKMEEFIKNAQYAYDKIARVSQKSFYLALPAEESTLFYSLIVAPYTLKVNLSSKGKDLEKKICKVVNEEINIEKVIQVQENPNTKKKKDWHVSAKIKKILPYIPTPIKKLARLIVTKLGWRIL